MVKIVLFFLFIQLAFLPIYAQEKVAHTSIKSQDCEQLTKVALEQLVAILQKNDFENLEPVLATIQNTCGENELTERLRILRALIEKKDTQKLISNYIIKGHKSMLETRWISSAETQYATTYRKHKDTFYFVPLRHDIDSQTKIKALALLNSAYYTFNEVEENIVLLFADQIPRQIIRTRTSKSGIAQEQYGLNIYTGIELPWAGMTPQFGTAYTLGLSVSNRLSSLVLFEIGMKLNLNSKQDHGIEYSSYDGVTMKYPNYSVSGGGTIGYKVFDNDKLIIYPKIGLFYEGTIMDVMPLASTYYDYGDKSYETETSTLTMRATLALATMYPISDKTFIGLEAAYHYIPYNWDKEVLTHIQPHFKSLQLFFRFSIPH